MPRNMSFMLTQPQVLERTKTVTRRLGWSDLLPGDLFWACDRTQGLKAGQKPKRLALCRCVSNREERLDEITLDDVVLEGFGGWTPERFVEHFCKSMKTFPRQTVNRIEYAYEDSQWSAVGGESYTLRRNDGRYQLVLECLAVDSEQGARALVDEIVAKLNA